MAQSTSSSRLKFLRPADEDFEQRSWEEDKVDINPISSTSFIYNPYHSLSLDRQRQKLPIYNNRDHIIYLLEKYQTLVLVGETGSGKSTQVPQYLLEAGWCANDKCIGITQPRRVAATTLASRVSDERGSLLGQEVGYSIRFDDKTTPNLTKIKYMTEGLLVREMMGDPLLEDYSVIILDEIHERTLHSDVLMGLLRKILKKRPTLRLIVSSATVDADEIVDFFNFVEKKRKIEEKRGKNSTSVALSLSGRLHPVQIYYSSEPVADYVSESVKTVVKIHESCEDGDILVFLTGQDEVEKAITLLQSHVESKKGGKNNKLELFPLPIYGSLGHRDQLKVFQKTPDGKRKVVVSTNIAETSITLHGVVFVVDCGFVKMKWFNPNTLSDSLVVIPISKASAVQRAGRAGRTKEGKVYRLYPEEEYEKLVGSNVPEIQRSDLSSTILHLKSLGIQNIVRFHFPAPPPASNLLAGVELLFALGALDKRGNLTSPLGEQMSELPLSPIYSKILLISGEMGCSEEISTIIGMLEVESVFQSPFGENALKARSAKRLFEVGEGDLITLLNVYTAFVKNGKTKSFCSKYFLHFKRIRRAIELKEQMLRMLKKFNIPIVSCGSELEPILKCICTGLFPNAAYLHHSGNYRTVRGDLDISIHPSSVLYTLPPQPLVLFGEIIETNSVYMRDLTVVSSEWLQELAPHYYLKSTERFYS